MGWQATGWAFNSEIQNAGAKFVLVALAERAGNEDDNSDWTCYPSIETIAKYTAQGYRTIQRHLDWLEENGFISRQRRPGIDGKKGCYLFTLHRHAKMATGQNGSAHRPKTTLQTGQNGQTEPVIGTDQEEPNRAIALVGRADDVRQAFLAWNVMIEGMGGSPARALNDDRRRRIKARLKDCGGIEAWCALMDRIPLSPFLRGDTPHHFAITLDFVLQPSSFTKLVEGFYHDANRSQTDGQLAGHPGPTDRAAERAEERGRAIVAGAQAALDGRGRRKWRL